MVEYTIAEAHRDGRHASVHPEDRAYWVKAGCGGCGQRFDAQGLPLVSLLPIARADVSELVESVKIGVESVSRMTLLSVAALLEEAVRVMDAEPDCDHTEVAWDTTAGPNRDGSIVVTEFCGCGRVIGTRRDSVL